MFVVVVKSAGRLRTGRVVSVTTTMKVPVEVPKLFVDEQLTVVFPIGKSEPEAWSQVAPPALNETFAPEADAASAATTSGSVSIGGPPPGAGTKTQKVDVGAPQPLRPP